MATRLFLLPIVEVYDPTGIVLQARAPKYLPWPRNSQPFTPLITNDQNLARFWEARDFGLELTALVAIDVSTSQRNLLTAQPDVVIIPANLDAAVGANLATVRAQLEDLHIPGDAITASTTYRQVVRGVMAIFAVAQRFDGNAGGRIFPAGISLSTPLSDLSANVRRRLQDAATELGYSYEGLTLASSIRDVLKALATQQAPGTMLDVAI